MGKKEESPNCIAVQPKDSFFFSMGKAASRLFVVFMAAIQLFDDVVASCTSRNGSPKSNDNSYAGLHNIIT